MPLTPEVTRKLRRTLRMPSIEYCLGTSNEADLMGKQYEANPVTAL